MAPASLAVDCDGPDALMDVEDAFAAILGGVAPVGDIEMAPLAAAAGRIAAADIRTAIALPPFDHAAVDGYGVGSDAVDIEPPAHLRIVARFAAGDRVGRDRLAPGEAVRLFTGAPVPPGVAAVVAEERCFETPGGVLVRVRVPDGANIRRRGEDVADGATIIERGTLLDARHVAMLAAAGVTEAPARRAIRVAVVATGEELRPPGARLDAGAIHDSNSPMLAALLDRRWIERMPPIHIGDRPGDLRDAFRELARAADVIISTGGAAGSETDHAARAVAAAGGRADAYRLALRPGKPIVAGRIGDAAFLGLPGNPVAALVNFLLFGRALLLARAGAARVERPPGQPAAAASAMRHAPGRTEFAPAAIVGREPDGRPRIEKLGKGGSARLRPLALADGFAEITAASGDLAAGAPVCFHPFGQGLAP